jgi:hypothetical protein
VGALANQSMDEKIMTVPLEVLVLVENFERNLDAYRDVIHEDAIEEIVLVESAS